MTLLQEDLISLARTALRVAPGTDGALLATVLRAIRASAA
jgi:hypothetical protein